MKYYSSGFSNAIGETSLFQYKNGKAVLPYFYSMPDSSEIRPGLGRRYKLTDFLWPVRLVRIYEQVISASAYTIMQDFNLAKHNTMPLEVKKNGRSYEYLHFLFYESIFDFIHLDTLDVSVLNGKAGKDKSIRKIEQPSLYAENVLRKKNFPGYKRIKWDYVNVINNLDLKEGFDLDFFSIGKLATGAIISQRLKDCFDENKVTGLEYTEVNFLHTSK